MFIFLMEELKFKVVQNSFQQEGSCFQHLEFNHWVILTTLYHLMVSKYGLIIGERIVIIFLTR